MEQHLNIAIDGPSGAGKSTLARMLAETFGFLYMDTGAIYRTLGLFVLRSGIRADSEADVVSLLPHADIRMFHDASGRQRMLLNGEDVTEAIRTPEVSLYASAVSALPAVRAYLLNMQRDFAKKHNVIMDGRDIGTVVIPDADLKVFLTASPEERARRRLHELKAKGIDAELADVLRDISKRDNNDSSRAAAPLKPAKDAVLLDTTGNSLDASFRLLKRIVEERLYERPV